MNGLPKPPTIRSILLGIALFIVAFLAFLRLPDVVKFAGAALMYVPAKVGLIDMVSPQDVIPMSLAENPSIISIASPGQYLLYMSNLDLLVIHDAIVKDNSQPWMKIQPEHLDTELEITLIGRGLAWYDTPFAAGRPVVTFRVDQPGVYRVTHPTRPDTAYLVPDTLTGKESLITFWVLAELALIGGVIFYSVRKRTANSRAQRLKIQAEHRARVEDSRKRIEKRAEEKHKDEDQPYWKKR
ncbi:MAG: hypothetical protein JW963_06995 [Anaerolineales bacterium]|nr:hypothetical protein [Anaerolineales bacterium]